MMLPTEIVTEMEPTSIFPQLVISFMYLLMPDVKFEPVRLRLHHLALPYTSSVQTVLLIMCYAVTCILFSDQNK